MVYRPLVASGVAMGTSQATNRRCYLSINTSTGAAQGAWGNTTVTGGSSIVGRDVVQITRIKGATIIDVFLNGVQMGTGSETIVPATNGVGIGGIGVAGGGSQQNRTYRSFMVNRAWEDREILPASKFFGRGIVTF
jgi:hypothetical protein